MGIALELWKQRIGTFINPGSKCHGRICGYTIPRSVRHGLRFLLWLCVFAYTNTEQLRTTANIVNTPPVLKVFSLSNIRIIHQNHTTGGKMTGSVHSLVTRIRSGDIEMYPGPETQQQSNDTPARRTRQATLRDAPFDIWGRGGGLEKY